MIREIAPWLLKSKVAPPRQLLSIIERPKLINALDIGAEGALVILEAPGGYGKSCLLSQWRDKIEAEGASVCWLSIDEDDDPETFIAYLAYAAHEAGLDASSTGLLNFEYSTEKVALQSVYQFLGLLERSDKPVIVVLDDFERCSQAVKESVIPVFLRRLPSNATAVIASREAVDISTVDLDHRGLVARLGPEHLRFAKREMETLWKGRLTSRQVDRLAEKTEGWPVLIRLLLTASDMGTFDLRHIDQISYQDVAITSYFEQKILGRLRIEVRELLLKCSVFEEISEEAVVQVLDAPPDGIFELLGSFEAFVAPISGYERSYRLHPMMRDYLRRTLVAQMPEAFVDIQKRAALWCSENGNHVRAVKHAIDSGDEDLVISILENTGGLGLWLREGLIEFRVIDRYISEEILERSPTSALMRCIIWMKSGKQSQAGKLFYETLARHAEQFENDLGLSVSATITKLMMAVYSGDKIADSDVEKVESAIRHDDEDHLAFSGYVLTFKCVAAHQAGRLRDAISFADEALEVFAKMGSLYGEVYIHLHLAMIHALRRARAESRSEFQQASELIRRDLSYDEGIKYLSDVLRIEADHEHSPLQLKSASRLNSIVTKLLKAEGWLDIYAGAFRTLSEQAVISGSRRNAFQILDLAVQFATRNSLEFLEEIADSQRALIKLAGKTSLPFKQMAGVLEAFKNFDPMDRMSAAPWRVVEIQAELALAMNRIAPFDLDVRAIERYKNTMYEEGNIRIVTRLCAELALSKQQCDMESHLLLLDKVAKENRFARSTIFVADALSEKLSEGGLSEHYPHLYGRLRRQIKLIELKKASEGQQSMISAKEAIVLRELQKGDTDKQIALTLGVTEHAIRYHLKNLYVKLNVKNRNEAVSKAIEMKVL